MADLDRDRFIGRSEYIRVGRRILDPNDQAVVLFVSGPGGIGKSSLVRNLAREAADTGWSTHWIDGREIGVDPDSIDRQIDIAIDAARPFVVLDTYERLEILGGHIRTRLLELPSTAAICVVSRKRAESGWLSGGWEGCILELPMAEMTDTEARLLLAARGVTEPDRIDHALAWAKGSPLALSLAAEAHWSNVGPNAEPPPVLVDRLVRRLVDDELDGPHLETLAVAMLARTTTVRLLEAVLPDADANAEAEWLTERSFVEVVGTGFALHDLVARALRATMTLAAKETVDELRSRVADAICANTSQPLAWSVAELVHLTANPTLKWGLGNQDSQHHFDVLRPGDGPYIEKILIDHNGLIDWKCLDVFLRNAPETVTIIRNISGLAAGVAVCVSPATAPLVAEHDPVVGPWLKHTRTLPDGDRSLLWHCAMNLSLDQSGEVQGMMGMAGLMYSKVANPRYMFLPINPKTPEAVNFATEAGGHHLEALDCKAFGLDLNCYMVDNGPAGTVDALRVLVHFESGITNRFAAASLDTDVVRAALKDRHHPDRVKVLAALDRCFSDSPDDRILRACVELGYLNEDASTDIAARELHLSRASYFRRLREAIERIAAFNI